MDLVQRARERYSAGRMHDALEAAQAACDRAPKDAEAWWLLGRVSRHVGLAAASDDAFRRAAALTRSRPLPYRVSGQRFQALPSVEDVREGVEPDALTMRSRGTQDVLTVFQVNHENRSGSEAALRTLVGRSLSRA